MSEVVSNACGAFVDIIPAEQICQAAGKAVCVGRNFVAHAKELSNPVPKEPVLFTKTPNCFVPFGPQLQLPIGYGECHHELELVFIVGRQLSAQSFPVGQTGAALAAMRGLTLGIDLTLRDVQSALKGRALPWARAKCFDGAAPVTDGLVLPENHGVSDLNDFHMQLRINGEVRQLGHLRDLVFDLDCLVAEIVQFMTLEPGDLIFTGTLAGVGSLGEGDVLVSTLWSGAQTIEDVGAKVLIDAQTRVI